MSVLIRKSDGQRLRGVFDGDLMELPFVRRTGYPPAGYTFGHLAAYLERSEADEDALDVLAAAEAAMPPKRRPGDEAVFGRMMAYALRLPPPLPDGREPYPGAPRETYMQRPGVVRRVYRTDVLAARAWARRHDHRGNGGGWIRDQRERPVCQGWGKFADRLLASGQIRKAEGGWVLTEA